MGVRMVVLKLGFNLFLKTWVLLIRNSVSGVIVNNCMENVPQNTQTRRGITIWNSAGLKAAGGHA
jgi:hypothetical protein